MLDQLLRNTRNFWPKNLQFCSRKSVNLLTTPLSHLSAVYWHILVWSERLQLRMGIITRNCIWKYFSGLNKHLVCRKYSVDFVVFRNVSCDLTVTSVSYSPNPPDREICSLRTSWGLFWTDLVRGGNKWDEGCRSKITL